ncbi:TolC family outer membrane protein [Sphingomonas sp. SRS2]|uniref:TolC family outer membrane protein n=1 Tax=Sphingomonas sp. SRS2 TaxID=133190 RepID=UPI000696756A|nr:TolC family outer membrane protein [Sphingomonas sp. SRS2]
MIFTIDPITIKANRLGARRWALLLSAATVMLAPAPAFAETLMDAVASAYASNPTLTEQRYRQKSVNENYVQTRAQYGPSLSVSATATYDYSKTRITSTFDRVTSDKIGDATLNLRQQVYSGGRVRGALEEARANVHASEEQLRRVEGQIVQNVIAAYAAVLRDQYRLAVSRENVQVLRDQLDARRTRRKVRDVTLTDVAQADARLASGEVQIANAVAQLSISRGEYLQVVGHEPGELAPLPELPGLPTSIDEAFAIADAENANLLAARHAEMATRANIAEQRGGQRPSAVISAQAGKTGDLRDPSFRDYTTEVLAQVTITQPLWQGGAIRSRIRQAQDQNNAAQAVVDGERRQALQDVVLAWNQLASARVAVTSGTRQVEATQIAFAGMQREEGYGLRSPTEVLNSEQELASAQLNLLSSRYQEYIARAALLLAMGRLDARTVNSAIPAKDPEAEFKKVRWRGLFPTDPAMILIDHIGAAPVNSKRKPDLRGNAQPKPTGSSALPPTPGKQFTDAPLVPITQSPLREAGKLPPSVQHYETAPGDEKPPR